MKWRLQVACSLLLMRLLDLFMRLKTDTSCLLLYVVHWASGVPWWRFFLCFKLFSQSRKTGETRLTRRLRFLSAIVVKKAARTSAWFRNTYGKIACREGWVDNTGYGNPTSRPQKANNWNPDFRENPPLVPMFDKDSSVLAVVIWQTHFEI